MSNAELAVLEVALPPFVPREDARLLLAMKLFETGHLSLGQAACMASLSMRGFLETASRQGVAVVNYPASELAEETAW
jgi:predicted HTH domain antitoxin